MTTSSTPWMISWTSRRDQRRRRGRMESHPRGRACGGGPARHRWMAAGIAAAALASTASGAAAQDEFGRMVAVAGQSVFVGKPGPVSRACRAVPVPARRQGRLGAGRGGLAARRRGGRPSPFPVAAVERRNPHGRLGRPRRRHRRALLRRRGRRTVPPCHAAAAPASRLHPGRRPRRVVARRPSHARRRLCRSHAHPAAALAKRGAEWRSGGGVGGRRRQPPRRDPLLPARRARVAARFGAAPSGTGVRVPRVRRGARHSARRDVRRVALRRRERPPVRLPRARRRPGQPRARARFHAPGGPLRCGAGGREQPPPRRRPGRGDGCGPRLRLSPLRAGRVGAASGALARGRLRG